MGFGPSPEASTPTLRIRRFDPVSSTPALQNSSLYFRSPFPGIRSSSVCFWVRVAVMGAAARWFRALIGIKKTKPHGGKDDLKSSTTGKSKRWLVRRLGLGKPKEETSHHNANDFITVETSNRFDVLKTHILDSGPLEAQMQAAAIKIQCGFRRFLARRAYRALRALVRIQAMFRGNQVRKQIRSSGHKQLCYYHAQLQEFLADNKKKAWCDCQGTLQEINARLQRRQDATMNRERAIVYALSHQFNARKALNKKCWQQWDAGLLDPTMDPPTKNPLRVQIMPQIAISYYYSGPVFASSPSASSSCGHGLNAMHVHCRRAKDMCNKKPGYMETTMSMQAKHRSLSTTDLQHRSAHFHCKRRHTSIACLDNHQLLLQCS